MTLLLRVAGGELRPTDEDLQSLGASAEKIHKAAVFFIGQVCLVSGADHYWILGLNAGADLQRIKEHHRILIRLFHPDRRESRDNWTDAYAARINQAYNVLRRPALRTTYDASLSQRLREPRSPLRGAADYRLRKLTRLPIEGPAPVFRLPYALVRRLVKPALAGVGAMVVVLGIFLLNGRTVPAVLIGVPISSPLEHMDELPLAGLNNLIERYARAYEVGNLEKLMALVDADARRSEADEEAEIRSHYQGFFDATQSRRIVLKDVRWRSERGYFQGDGSFLVQVQRRDTDGLQDYMERIRFDIGERNGELHIRGIYHGKD